MPEIGYREQLEDWRLKREQKLRSDDGWLSVAGLFWLEEGASRFGTSPDNEIILPEGSAPALVGTFQRTGNQVTVHLEPGTQASIDGHPIEGPTGLRPDSQGQPEVLHLGDRLRLHAIERGGRFGLRLKDLQSPMRLEFQGLSWFPIDEEWRIEAHFQAYDPPRIVEVPNILNQSELMTCPGIVLFTVAGQEFRLEPVLESATSQQFFFIFRDATSGHGTYPSGRFLYSKLPDQDGRIQLDFNKAYSPPCAFTAYATCPLPPPQNRLQLQVEAGEKYVGTSH